MTEKNAPKIEEWKSKIMISVNDYRFIQFTAKLP